MVEFFCGLLFYACGMAMIFHSKTLVERSAEFRKAGPLTQQLDRLERVLCIIGGVVVATSGYLTILFRA